jgi:hypothetical protein
MLSLGRIFGLAVIVSMAAGAPGAAQSPSPQTAHEVFIRIAAPLDEARGLCLDIPGHRDRVNVSRPLVVHTCKWDIWNLDERFDAAALEQGVLRMPAYDLCVGADRAAPGANIVLRDCDALPEHGWIVDEGRIQLAAAPNLCLTVGSEPSRLTPGGQRLPSRHVARSLALERCQAAARDRQIWLPVSPGP